MTRISADVGEVLKHKGNEVWSVGPEQTVYQAIEKMADKSVGALLVLSEGAPVGIISERDYARKVILRGRSSRITLVGEIMTKPVISVEPSRRIAECMALMTQNRIRHLPVIANAKILGIVSMGDMVKWIVSRQEEMIEQLQNYITASYPV